MKMRQVARKFMRITVPERRGSRTIFRAVDPQRATHQQIHRWWQYWFNGRNRIIEVRMGIPRVRRLSAYDFPYYRKRFKHDPDRVLDAHGTL